MPTYLYQLAYTPDSLAAQIKNPQDRLEVAARPTIEAAGGKLLAGGFAFGEYDIVILAELPDDESMASVALAFAGGGAARTAKTTKLLTGSQWISALGKASNLAKTYKPAR